eukprot:35686-Chlamydomonas_euryale.AAC.1
MSPPTLLTPFPPPARPTAGDSCFPIGRERLPMCREVTDGKYQVRLQGESTQSLEDCTGAPC